MKYVAPTAAAMGQNIETVSAAIGMLGNAGIREVKLAPPCACHAKAGQAPKKMARDALANLGVQVTNSRGQDAGYGQHHRPAKRAQQQYGTNTTAFAQT